MKKLGLNSVIFWSRENFYKNKPPKTGNNNRGYFSQFVSGVLGFEKQAFNGLLKGIGTQNYIPKRNLLECINAIIEKTIYRKMYIYDII